MMETKQEVLMVANMVYFMRTAIVQIDNIKLPSL